VAKLGCRVARHAGADGGESRRGLADLLCTAMQAMGSEADWAQLDPDFVAGKKALVAEDWNAAIAAHKLAALRDPGNADIQNYIGYAYRRLRQMGPAMQYYQQALGCPAAAPLRRARPAPDRARRGARAHCAGDD
jgi:Flp pilus assembly protein TadD